MRHKRFEVETEIDYPMTFIQKIQLSTGFGLFFIILAFVIVTCCTSSCTISMQNISTHGVASDLVDENQSATPTTNASLNIPKL